MGEDQLNINIKDVVNITKYDKYEDWSCIKDFDKIMKIYPEWKLADD